MACPSCTPVRAPSSCSLSRSPPIQSRGRSHCCEGAPYLCGSSISRKQDASTPWRKITKHRQTMSPAFTMAMVSVVFALFSAEQRGVLAQEETATDDDGGDDPVWQTLLQYLIIIVLVASSGLFSGLTLGLLGLDKIGLEIIGNGDEPRMAAFAKKIQPVRADGNLLLCTLLLGNVAVNALLSIVMAQLTSGLVGFALATAIITIFGEIIPQAVCSRHALRIGSTVVPIVRVIMVILYPVTKPLSLMLDKMLGDEIGTIHSRTELRELLKIHVQHGALDVETGRELAGAMNYKQLTVRDVMTPAKDCFMLSVSEKLNFKTLSIIFKSGFSRIPVFAKDRNDVIGLLFTKDLIFIDPDDETPLKNFVQIFGRAVTMLWPDMSLGEVLKVYKQGRSHLGLVRDVNNSGEGDPFYEILGIITLEDIIEEILGDEIVDETDAFVDVETQLPVERREFDMSRLQLLNAQADTSALSTEEAKAVTSHLMANVPQFTTLQQKQVEVIIAASPVTRMSREVSEGTLDPAPSEVLYRRGRTSTVCTLILAGRVVVRAGKDGFQSDAGPWSVLAADALVEEEGAYKPDFSAHVGSEHLRCIRISKASFESISALSKDVRGEPVTPNLHDSNGSNGRRRSGSLKSGGWSAKSLGSEGVTGTPMSRSSRDGKQKRLSPGGTRATNAESDLDSASSKIREAMNAAVTVDPAERAAAISESMGGAEEKRDIAGHAAGGGAVVPDKEIEGRGPVLKEENGEVATTSVDYTMADSTERDSGHFV